MLILCHPLYMIKFDDTGKMELSDDVRAELLHIIGGVG